MEEWKEYKAIDFCQNVTDGTHDSPKPKDEGHYLITSKHLKDGYIDFSTANKISEDDYQKIIQRSKVEQYDILYSMIGTIGNICQVVDDRVDFAVKNMGIFKMGGNQLKSKWLYYWFKTPFSNEYVNSRLAGSTQSYMTLKSLRDFPVYAPNEEKITKIVNILSSLDDKIEVNRRINEQLEELVGALFKSWFVDFEPFKDGEFVESELGMIPKGWKVGKFTDIVEIKGGGTPKTDIAEYWNGDIPFFTPKDINDVFCIDTEKNITDLGLLKCSSKLYCKNTVFITARGTVGKVCMAGRNMAMNQTCYALIGKEKYGQHFIYMQTINIVERMKKKANGAVFSAITTRDFDSEKIIIPSLDVVNDFLIKIEPLYESILHNQQEITHLTTLRDTLLPKLMSGEIDVNEVKI